MYHTCIFCNNDLLTNEIVEHLPIGRRIAFDPALGRLWVVCIECERWNLTPFDRRFEAIETCERLFRAEPKKVASSNIGLARLSEGLELVRIGKPPRQEFAAWRYGDQFGRRRQRALAQTALATGACGLALVGALALGAAALVGGLAYYWGVRQLQDKRARRIVGSILTNDGGTVAVWRKHLPDVRLIPDAHGPDGWKLLLPHANGAITVSGEYAISAIGQLLPAINGRGAREHRVRHAIRRLEGMHDTIHFIRSAASLSAHGSRPGRLGTITQLPVDVRLAIEMAANEETERFAMAGELWLLEWAWEQAEVIAGISDRLLVPAEIESKLQELRRRSLNRTS